MFQQRYISFKSGIGAKMEAGTATLEDMEVFIQLAFPLWQKGLNGLAIPMCEFFYLQNIREF